MTNDKIAAAYYQVVNILDHVEDIAPDDIRQIVKHSANTACNLLRDFVIEEKMTEIDDA